MDINDLPDMDVAIELLETARMQLADAMATGPETPVTMTYTLAEWASIFAMYSQMIITQRANAAPETPSRPSWLQQP